MEDEYFFTVDAVPVEKEKNQKLLKLYKPIVYNYDYKIKSVNESEPEGNVERTQEDNTDVKEGGIEEGSEDAGEGIK
jgi:hypothetical protein